VFGPSTKGSILHSVTMKMLIKTKIWKLNSSWFTGKKTGRHNWSSIWKDKLQQLPTLKPLVFTFYYILLYTVLNEKSYKICNILLLNFTCFCQKSKFSIKIFNTIFEKKKIHISANSIESVQITGFWFLVEI